MTSISVIIPQYGQQNLTTRLIGQLRQFEPSETELIVVDDGSPEGTVSDKLSDEKIRFIQQTHRGVTATWNTGAKEATGNVLVFLNNDVNVTGPFLTPLIEPLFHSDPAMTGPQLRTERLLPITLSPKSPRTLLEGWCVAVGRETFDRLQSFDERFQMYFSDTDFQWRLLASHSQAKLIAVPDLPLQHLGHVSTRNHPKRHQLHAADCQKFLEKWKA